MNMKNKEQLLYFFLQGKISLSQYDYKFMANLQTMIQNNARVTSNQADLFDKLISKYNKQLTKQGFIKEELKLLPWKTMVVESTSEYTGAVVSLQDGNIVVRVPFNKTFIGEFRKVRNNSFVWDKDTKSYITPFGTNAFKIAYHTLPKFFSTVRYDDNLQLVLDELKEYDGLIWNPTLKSVNGSLVVSAINDVLGEAINSIQLSLDPKTLFKLSRFGIDIDPDLYKDDPKKEFASNLVYEAEIIDIEKIIGWMKNIGCENVLIGRAIRSIINQEALTNMIEKYGMRPIGPMAFGKIPDGVTMLIQHTSSLELRGGAAQGEISKTVVFKDSRPIEVK